MTATRHAEEAFRVPQFASTVPREEIERRIPSTTPDLLDRQAGILVQKTNLGDVKYKTHGSGIYFPGINAMLGLRCAF